MNRVQTLLTGMAITAMLALSANAVEVAPMSDAEFQKRCLGKMSSVAGEGRTVVFVSHNLGAVSQLCSRGLLVLGTG